MKVFAIAIFLLTTLLLTGCDKKTKSHFEVINHALDNSTSAKEIALGNLAENYEALDGQVIQTEGTTYFEFENVAICTDNSKNSECFWLDLNPDLPVNDSVLLQLSGQKLILKGTVDRSSKGHLGSYLATLRNVYYIKIK